MHSVVTILTAETDKVLDTVVVSKYCTVCDVHIKGNRENHRCQKNHEGSSGAMEVTGLKTAFEDSLDKFGFR